MRPVVHLDFTIYALHDPLPVLQLHNKMITSHLRTNYTGKLPKEQTPPHTHASHNNHTESKGEVNYTGSTNTFSSGAALLWVDGHERLSVTVRSHSPDSCLFCSLGSICSTLRLNQPNYKQSGYLGSRPLNGSECFSPSTPLTKQ